MLSPTWCRTILMCATVAAACSTAGGPEPGPPAAVAPRPQLRGMFTYFADAARFEECLTGSSLPVAMAEDYLALERAYTGAGGEPGQPILAVVEGRIEPRPAMEGDGMEESLVVERFERLWPGETCGARGVVAELEGTYWKLTRLAEEPVVVPLAGREPHLVLEAEGRARGFGGCNRLMGGYAVDEATVTFSGIAMTRMFCPEGMEVETGFGAALDAARSWRILGQHLELYDEAGALLARFEARNLP